LARSGYTVIRALLVTAVVLTVVVAWSGWLLLKQGDAIEKQRERERAESSAEALREKIRGKLAGAGDQLSAWLSQPEAPLPAIEGTVVFAERPGRVELHPSGALPFVPSSDLPAVADPLLASAETSEFSDGKPEKAAAAYRELSRHPKSYVRAGALLRLGRVLRISGDWTGALAAYRRLASMGSLLVEGYPAELAGLDGERLTLASAGDNRSADLARKIVELIDAGRWQLNRGTAEYYRSELASSAKPESWRLAEALFESSQYWNPRPAPRGIHVSRLGEVNVIVMWRANQHGIIAAIGFADRFVPRLGSIRSQVVDAEGQLIAGDTSEPNQTVNIILNDPQKPWMLRVWSDQQYKKSSGFTTHTMLLMTTSVILFLWTAVYFIARAIRRESQVTRLQADFVAAVSHEFRSPLTTVRQLAEMLEMGQVPSAERRSRYYELLAGEARRLQRLVETLLNFRRMEAGADRYRLEEVDVVRLVTGVAADLDSLARESGKRIEVTTKSSVGHVLADADALALAVRNLVDNAMKYTPGPATIRIQLSEYAGRVSIQVVDHGLGIDRAEQKAIFRQFVRGRAAVDANVMGTGVGLAMVKHVLAAHNGEVRVESEPGKGSTFTLLLPAVH
jgi:signal transduction histidine kinase